MLVVKDIPVETSQKLWNIILGLLNKSFIRGSTVLFVDPSTPLSANSPGFEGFMANIIGGPQTSGVDQQVNIIGASRLLRGGGRESTGISGLPDSWV